MRIKGWVTAASIGFGLLFWVIDTIVGYSFLYEGSFWGLLVSDVPKTAVYIRLTVLGFFIIFGVATSDIIAKSRAAAAQLKESEEKFRRISASAKDAIIMVDNEGNISYWNEAAEAIFRYRKNEIIGRDIIFLLPEKHHETWKREFRRFRATGYTPLMGKTVEMSGIKKGGDEIPLEISFSALKLKNRWHAMGIIRDITARKKAETELKIKDLAVDSTINAITLLEPKGKLTYTNPAFLRMWGYEEKDAVGRHFVEFWEDEHKALDVLDTIREKGSYIGELKARRKDESLFDVQVSASVVTDDVGKSLSIIASFIDITDRKSVEEKLAERSAFEKLVTAISTNFINLPSDRIDSEISTALQSIGEFADVERCCVYLYSPENQAMSMTHEWCSPMVTPRFHSQQDLPLKKHRWQVERLKSRETIYITDLEELPSDAEALQQDLAAWGVRSFIQVPIASAGKAFGFLGLESHREGKSWPVDIVVLLRIVGDIFANALERKRVEEQLNASLREKELLLKEIHHRVKNNMQVISSLLSLQAGRTRNKKILEMLRESQDRIRSMSLIHERLYQSKDLAKVNFSQYVESLARYLFQSYKILPESVVLEVKTGAVSLNINKAIPCGLILNELISNSLKYAFPFLHTEERRGKKGKISIELSPVKDKVLLLFKDNGIGLPEDLNIETASSFGLQLVTTLVGQLNGTMEIEKKPGATFRILFEKD